MFISLHPKIAGMLEEIVDKGKIYKLKEIIDESAQIVIVSHEMPDGDAIGSALGLYHYLMPFSKQSIQVIVPNAFPEFLKWLPDAKDIFVFDTNHEMASQMVDEADLILCLDFNAVKRVGKMAPALVASRACKVLIDHHLEPEIFGSLVISQPELSSTSELLFRIIYSLGDIDRIGQKAAECFYTGMMTDTGAFSYNSNNSEIYLIINELLKKGIDKDEIYRKVYQVYSESRLRLMGYVLYKKMKLYPNLHTALFTLERDELNHFRYKCGDTESFVNLPLSIKGIIFSVFLREERNFIKVSLRSSGDFPCNVFAAHFFSGGGHKNASGGEFYGSMENAVKAFEAGIALFNPNNFKKSRIR